MKKTLKKAGSGGYTFMHWHFTVARMLQILLYNALGTTLTGAEAYCSSPACEATEILYTRQTVVLPESDIKLEALQ